MVQWLEFRPFTAEGWGSNPGQGTKIPHTHQKKALGCGGLERRCCWDQTQCFHCHGPEFDPLSGN